MRESETSGLRLEAQNVMRKTVCIGCQIQDLFWGSEGFSHRITFLTFLFLPGLLLGIRRPEL